MRGFQNQYLQTPKKKRTQSEATLTTTHWEPVQDNDIAMPRIAVIYAYNLEDVIIFDFFSYK